MRFNRFPGALTLLITLLTCGPSFAADWPTYRADAARSGYSADQLPQSLELRWVYRGSVPQPTWPSSARITYDFADQPILVDGTVIVGSSADNSVTALNALNGHVQWKFLAGGPIRFAPTAWRDRLFVACDDGYLYALSIADGVVLWKHRGGPSDRMCLGNERMISRWPARGGAVVLDDTVYYAAGIWPSGGVYLHALDAATGQTVWSNGETGQLLMPQPHGGAEAHSGVAPQGYLVAVGDLLFTPTGRAVPAAFQRGDGKLLHYLLQQNGSIGGSRVIAAEQYVINGGCFLEQSTGELAARAGRGVLSVRPEGVLQFTGDRLIAYHWADKESVDRKGRSVKYRGLEKSVDVAVAETPSEVREAAKVAESLPSLKPLFRTEVVFKEQDPSVSRQTGLERTLSQSRPDVERLGGDVRPFQAAAYEQTCEVISAGDEAVCGHAGKVSIVDLRNGNVRWSQPVEGAAIGLATANGTLVVATADGVLYGFGASSGEARKQPAAKTAPSVTASAETSALAEEILSTSGIQQGFCLNTISGDGSLALELVRHSELYVIGLCANDEQTVAARRKLADAGVYGNRVTILNAEMQLGLLPDYFADLIVSPKAADEVLHSLQRPDGGVICYGTAGKLQVSRRGPLPGAGLWTHQNANPANTLCSDDMLIRGPLETSWYRDGVVEIADRHAQAPAPLYNRGVLVVEGVHAVCGLDAYNGRTRWVYPISNILADWDGVHHDVGVGDVGSNVCLGSDAVFVRNGATCLKLDLQTGRKLAEFQTPVAEDAANRNWGYVACVGGTLFGTVLNDEHTVSPRYRNTRLRTESVLFFALDANDGDIRWTYKPEHSIRNNAIAIADGRVFLIDRPIASVDRITDPQPNGKHRPKLAAGEHEGGTLLAFNARDGKQVWKNARDIWGTQLAVTSQPPTLLMFYQGVKHNFFRLPTEVGDRMAAFSAETGKKIWDKKAVYKTRPLVNDGVIYAEGGAWDLRTGSDLPWKFQRSYGCGQIASSRNLMLFRSATLGYLDLTRDVGTENFGGIRPSCWFNAIPAGGMVLVPDGSSKCACSYQMHAWLALQPSEAARRAER